MNKHTLRYLIALIVLVGLLAIIYSTAPKQKPKLSQTTDNTPQGSVVIPISIVTFKQDSTSTPSISYEYPQFPSLPTDLNEAISSSTLSRVAEFKGDVTDNYAARNATAIKAEAGIPLNVYSFISSWQPAQINSRFISLIIRYDSYTGGANGNQDLQTFNYDVANNRMVTLADLFTDMPDYLAYISTTTREQLRRSEAEASPGYVPGQMFLDGTGPTLGNFTNFTFTDNIVTFYFPKYGVAPGSFGEQRAEISLHY